MSEMPNTQNLVAEATQDLKNREDQIGLEKLEKSLNTPAQGQEIPTSQQLEDVFKRAEGSIKTFYEEKKADWQRAYYDAAQDNPSGQSKVSDISKFEQMQRESLAKLKTLKETFKTKLATLEQQEKTRKEEAEKKAREALQQVAQVKPTAAPAGASAAPQAPGKAPAFTPVDGVDGTQQGPEMSSAPILQPKVTPTTNVDGTTLAESQSRPSVIIEPAEKKPIILDSNAAGIDTTQPIKLEKDKELDELSREARRLLAEIRDAAGTEPQNIPDLSAEEVNAIQFFTNSTQKNVDMNSFKETVHRHLDTLQNLSNRLQKQPAVAQTKIPQPTPTEAPTAPPEGPQYSEAAPLGQSEYAPEQQPVNPNEPQMSGYAKPIGQSKFTPEQPVDGVPVAQEQSQGTVPAQPSTTPDAGPQYTEAYPNSIPLGQSQYAPEQKVPNSQPAAPETVSYTDPATGQTVEYTPAPNMTPVQGQTEVADGTQPAFEQSQQAPTATVTSGPQVTGNDQFIGQSMATPEDLQPKVAPSVEPKKPEAVADKQPEIIGINKQALAAIDGIKKMTGVNPEDDTKNLSQQEREAAYFFTRDAMPVDANPTFIENAQLHNEILQEAHYRLTGKPVESTPAVEKGPAVAKKTVRKAPKVAKKEEKVEEKPELPKAAPAEVVEAAEKHIGEYMELFGSRIEKVENASSVKDMFEKYENARKPIELIAREVKTIFNQYPETEKLSVNLDGKTLEFTRDNMYKRTFDDYAREVGMDQKYFDITNQLREKGNTFLTGAPDAIAKIKETLTKISAVENKTEEYKEKNKDVAAKLFNDLGDIETTAMLCKKYGINTPQADAVLRQTKELESVAQKLVTKLKAVTIVNNAMD